MKIRHWGILAATALAMLVGSSPGWAGARNEGPLLASGAAPADGPWIGTWKKRAEPGSTGSPEIFSMWLQGDGFGYALDMASRSGEPVHMRANALFDDKPHVERGNASADHNVFRRVNDHTYALADIKNGKPHIWFKVVISGHGNIRTAYVTALMPNGKKMHGKEIWDRVQPKGDPASPVGPWIGTWKRNSEKSSSPGTALFHMWVDGDGFKYTIGSLTQVMASAAGKFDGKPAREVGNPGADFNVFRRVDDHTYALYDLKDGKRTNSFMISITPDGKTRTSVARHRDAQGKEVVSIGVWDRVK